MESSRWAATLIPRVRVLVAALVFPAVAHAQTAARRTSVPGAPAGITAFVNVSVVPMDTERVIPNQTVLVERGWIMAIGPSTQIKVPAGAKRIEGQGQYLMPGLGDMHAHLTAVDSIEAERKLFEALTFGLTTIRVIDPETGVTWKSDTNDYLGGKKLALRARVNAGQMWSPWIPSMSGSWAPHPYTGGYGADAGTQYIAPFGTARSGRRQPGDPPLRLDSVAAYLASYKAAGYDVVKLYYEAPSVVDSVIVAARRLGLPIVSHMNPWALTAPFKSVEHGYPMLAGMQKGTVSHDSALAFAQTVQRAGVWTVPGPLMGTSHPFTKILYDAGAGVLLGADCFGAGPVKRELTDLVRAGLTSYQALVTGTRNIAAYFGKLEEGGTVAVGKRADLLLLSSNPLADARYAATPAGVMIGGRWLSPAEIRRRLTEIKAARTAEGTLAGIRGYCDTTDVSGIGKP